jgi:hypothetical protein
MTARQSGPTLVAALTAEAAVKHRGDHRQGPPDVRRAADPIRVHEARGVRPPISSSA